jgi:GTP cyclohydrolase II
MLLTKVMNGKPWKWLAKVATLDALVERDSQHECPGFGVHGICVKVVAVAELPTRFGHFRVVAFSNNKDGKEHLALVHGEAMGGRDVPTRLHSECLTGDALGSLRCDCREQLQAALEALSARPYGILLYLRQEGRGIGLTNKIRAYSLQDRGLDTVDANLALGFRDDERDYAVAAHMLASLNVESVQLMTNNPKKIRGLEQHGIVVSSRLPHVMPANDHDRFYLQTKADRSGHLLDDAPRLPDQDEPLRGLAQD